jgi:hypothetical protein
MPMHVVIKENDSNYSMLKNHPMTLSAEAQTSKAYSWQVQSKPRNGYIEF